jgi:hypothetical protein
MNKIPLTNAQLDAITSLQEKLDALRKSIGVSDRGCILYRSELSYGEDECLVVEADGLGGAVLRIVDGIYPDNCMIRQELEFATEFDAVKAAELYRQQITA